MCCCKFGSNLYSFFSLFVICKCFFFFSFFYNFEIKVKEKTFNNTDEVGRSQEFCRPDGSAFGACHKATDAFLSVKTVLVSVLMMRNPKFYPKTNHSKHIYISFSEQIYIYISF